jgi:leader peptidase (prepilin peptidase)/N-methyltransferase
MGSFYPAYFFFVGLAAGSFLNVCIHRLPRGKSIVFPPSACPACGAPIRWRDNVPVLSFLLLRGKCRACRKRISPRYPLVELVTGLLFLFVALRLPLGWALLFPLYYGCILTVTFFTDLELQLIPDSLTLPAIPIGLLYHGWIGGEWLDSIAGVIVGGGSLWLIGALYQRVRHREGMGGGDVKLAAAMGAFLGWGGVLFVLFLSSLAGGLFGIGLLLFGGRRGSAAIPFGVFLAPIGFFALFFWKDWLGWYLRAVSGG